MDRLPPPVIPYAPLEVSELLPPTALKSPRATDPPELSLPSYRLNLLAAHNSTLYLAASDESVFAYAISRANGLSLVPVAAFPIVPPTPVNNVRVAPFPARFGGPALLLAGGDALAPGAPGSVSVLRLTPTAENPRTAETFYLRQKSAWGLSADAATGRVAVSTNSHCAAVLRVAEAGPDAFAEFAVPPLAGTHFGNIPCVSFSHSGLLLGSASIDTTFAVFDVAPPRAAARRLLQSPQRDPHDDEPAEYCWALAWIGPRTPRALRADDPAWPALFNRRKAASACSMLDALHDPSYAAADAAAAATAAASAAAAAARAARRIAALRLRPHPRKRPRTPAPRAAPARPCPPPLYDDADGGFLRGRAWGRGAEALSAGALPAGAVPAGRAVRVGGGCSFAGGGWAAGPGARRARAREPEDSLFVVGRERSLSLHRVVGGAGAEELDRVEPFAERRGRHARLSEVVEVPELSAVLVAQQHGAGIAVVRIVVRPPPRGIPPDPYAPPHEAIRYLLVVEAVLGDGYPGWIAGVCVVKREMKRRPPVFEVFIVRAAGTVEAYQVERKPCAVSAVWAAVV